ncbi:SRPBCC domain-containing protein [Erythrobacter sp. BLCC-B19]|uniref:SRPBCC domain-containing protein n=1 Tax=Erythrobacter sp. BLCC-B19 TaxID=3025315 RepID=UPI00235DF097|nr:SRPBCC domain-containing protein [Erythrobacter sp. BLCC-B19]WDA42601.1 SRPBCC domain-containing protein [Erythrobacter sp. BLCC-B19]
MTENTSYLSGELDREIVLSRVIEAPVERVYRAWVEPENMFKWFGPDGYKCDAPPQDEARVGTVRRFVMTGPDGQRWDSRMTFIEVVPNQRLVFDHGADTDDDPKRFRMTVTFDQQDDGKTVLTLRQLHPNKSQRDRGIGFGAVERGYETLKKLSEFVEDH